jgi:hypothetical protein
MLQNRVNISVARALTSCLAASLVPSVCSAQLVVGGQSALNSYQPSQYLGRFQTSVNRDRGGRRMGAMRGNYRQSMLGRASSRAWGGEASPSPTPYRPADTGTSAGMGRSMYPRRRASALTGYGAPERRMQTSTMYMGGAHQRPGPSVVDILAAGRGRTLLPPAPSEDASLPGTDEPLPKVFAGRREELDQWVDASQDSYIEAGQAQLRKKDYLTARGSFEAARTFNRDRAEPLIGLIQESLCVRHYFRPVQLIRELGSRSPEFAAQPFDVELWHETQEAYDEFLSRFRQDIADTTKAGERVRVLIGYVAWTTGDRERALDQFRRAAAAAPQEEAWVNIIRVLESPVRPKPSVLSEGTASSKPSNLGG